MHRTSLIACVASFAFLVPAALGQDTKTQTPATSKPAVKTTSVEPYPLATCAVTGEVLTDKAVTKVFDGRELRFASAEAVTKFESDKPGYLKKVDEAIIADQIKVYPTDKCLVSDEPLTGHDGEKPVDIVYNNRLVRLCCKGCMKDFNKDPQAVIAKLDKLATEQQRSTYSMKTCAVSGEELGSMGEPIEMVVGGRLVRLCCKGCIKSVKSEPAKYIAMVDAAQKKDSKPAEKGAGGKDGGKK